MANELAVVESPQDGEIVSIPNEGHVANIGASGANAQPVNYVASLPPDVRLDERDHEIFNEFAASLKGATPEMLAGAGRWYRDFQQKATQEAEAIDQADAHLMRTTMKAEWRGEYATNIHLINQYLDCLPPAVTMALENATLPDGTLALNSPSVLRWLAQQARGPVLSGQRPAQSYADEKADIEALMGNSSSAYWKGPNAERLQARYRDLVSKPNQEPAPRSMSSVDKEIVEIEQLMSKNPKKYYGDERIQVRYRQLLTLKQ